MYRNNGLPITAVRTPTGTPVGPSSLHRQSHMTRNMPPKAAEAGRRNLLSEPMRTLTIWGATSPTKPMTPVKLTATAVMKETTMRQIILVLHGSVPMVTAGLSPTERRFRSTL